MSAEEKSEVLAPGLFESDGELAPGAEVFLVRVVVREVRAL